MNTQPDISRLTILQVAIKCDVTRQTVYNWIKKGVERQSKTGTRVKLPSSLVNFVVHISMTDLETFLDAIRS